MLPRTLLISLVLSASLLPLSYPPVAQQQVNKFPHAIERSGDAGRIIASLALVSESGMPKELIDKAAAIGVFPKVTTETSMFTKFTQGYGVISARGENGWTMPAFYDFMGSGFGNPFARDDHFGVILCS